jgi:nucleoside phosphorylase
MSDNMNYTVGWICAIPMEYDAAQAFLDEVHEGPQQLSPHDNNQYVLGRIGRHYIVVAAMLNKKYDIPSTAIVVTHMLRSFPNIRVGLLVGIGGGAPSLKHDIRLGDIVVSAPRGGNGGVFQYDFGKTMQDQRFQSTGFLNQPPTLSPIVMVNRPIHLLFI